MLVCIPKKICVGVYVPPVAKVELIRIFIHSLVIVRVIGSEGGCVVAYSPEQCQLEFCPTDPQGSCPDHGNAVFRLALGALDNDNKSSEENQRKVLQQHERPAPTPAFHACLFGSNSTQASNKFRHRSKNAAAARESSTT